jgi:hypothetical protein
MPVIPVDAAIENPFGAGSPLIYDMRWSAVEQDMTSSQPKGIMTIGIYLIAAVVVICGCLFFFARARSHD